MSEVRLIDANALKAKIQSKYDNDDARERRDYLTELMIQREEKRIKSEQNYPVFVLLLILGFILCYIVLYAIVL